MHGIIAHCGKTDQSNAPSVYVIDVQTISPLLWISSFFTLQTPRVSRLTIEHSPRHNPYTLPNKSPYSDSITVQTTQQQYAKQSRWKMDTYRPYAVHNYS